MYELAKQCNWTRRTYKRCEWPFWYNPGWPPPNEAFLISIWDWPKVTHTEHHSHCTRVFLKRGFPGDSAVRNLPARYRRCKFSPWVGKIPWRRKWQPTPVVLPGKSHGQRSLEGPSPWGHRELDTTLWLNHHHHFKETYRHPKKPKKLTFYRLNLCYIWTNALGSVPVCFWRVFWISNEYGRWMLS